MTLRVISFGAGVQTTALAILNARGEIENSATELVMADPGAEKPETYEYLERHFRPWAEAHGLHLHVTSAKETLYEEAWRRRMIPSIHTRWCTKHHKVRVLRRWFRAHGATRKDPADVQIGISVDESHRAVAGQEVGYERRRWPLVELRISRADCHRIIAEAGLPQPPKSGCWYCPFQARIGWVRLASEHPELAAQAVALEANAAYRNPTEGLVGNRGKVKDLVCGGIQLPMGFDEQMENDQGCTSGACFV